MICFDSHTHSQYSFDTENNYSVDTMCRNALSRGITHLAITDHYDINAVVDGIYSSPEFDSRMKEIYAAREKYKGKLIISSGIELGSAVQYPERAKELLQKYSFDTVLASVHYMRGHNDFYYWDMTNENEESFQKAFLLYLKDIKDTLHLDGFHVLAHLTYPIRYFAAAGKRYPIDFAKEQLCEILKTVISKNILLEVNSSGFHQGLDSPLPDSYVLELYKQLGGKLISAGSDAHCPEDIGRDYGKCEKYLKASGFDEIHFYSAGTIYTQKI